MKELLAAVLGGPQSLGEDPVSEKPVDLLHAIGAGSAHGSVIRASRDALLVSLGRDLIALKHGGREASLWPAIGNLAEVLSWTSHRLDLKPWQRTAVARWALVEWVEDACGTCTGKGQIPMHQEAAEGRQGMKQCPTCSGIGKRRYSDEERLKALGLAWLGERPLSVAHSQIAAAEREAVQVTREMFERTP